MFTHDTSIFEKGDNPNDVISVLNNELKYITSWLNANQLSLNVGKTHFIVFSNCKVCVTRNVIIDGNELTRLSSTTFLGIRIDDKLSWKEHVTCVSTKLSKCIGIFHKCRHLLALNWRLHLYKAFMLPHLNDCNMIWSSTYHSSLHSVF